MLVTVFFDVLDKDEQEIIMEYLDIDIEVTEEEYERMDKSCRSHKFHAMYEDESLSDICDMCFDYVIDNGILGEEIYERTFGNFEEHLELLFDYPFEVLLDNAVLIHRSGFDAPVFGKSVPVGTRYIDTGEGKGIVVEPGNAEKALRGLLNEKRYISDKDISLFFAAIRKLIGDLGGTDETGEVVDLAIDEMNWNRGGDNER